MGIQENISWLERIGVHGALQLPRHAHASRQLLRHRRHHQNHRRGLHLRLSHYTPHFPVPVTASVPTLFPSLVSVCRSGLTAISVHLSITIDLSICIFACTSTLICVCIYTFVRVFSSIFVCTGNCTFNLACIWTCMVVNIGICMCICKCICFCACVYTVGPYPVFLSVCDECIHITTLIYTIPIPIPT